MRNIGRILLKVFCFVFVHCTDYFYSILNRKDMEENSETSEVKDEDEDAKPCVALFGFGRMGKIRLANLAHLRHLVHVMYIVDDFADDLKAAVKYWDLKNTKILNIDQSDTIWADESVDGVLITTPTGTHFDIVKTALQHGKHVMVEKPVCPQVEQVLECYRIAENAGKHILCAMNRRFDPDFQKIHDQIQSGLIGDLQLGVYANRDHPAPRTDYQLSSRHLMDMATHSGDLFCWLTGERPDTITALAHAQTDQTKKNKDSDTYGMIMKFPCGFIAYSDSTKFCPGGYDQRLEVVGTKGTLKAETEYENNVVTRDSKGTSTSPLHYSFPQKYKQSYINDLLHFIDVLKGVCEPLVTVDDASASLQIACSAEESWKTGKHMKMKWQH